MNKQCLRSFLSLLFVLCFSLIARGQTPTVNIYGYGPAFDTACTNSTHNYHAFCSDPRVSYYDFSYILGSESVYITSDTRSVLWGGPGTGMVIVGVYRNDTTLGSVLLVKDTLLVTILPLPSPTISTSNRVACEPLNDPGEGNPPGQFRDTGCQKVCAYSRATYTAKGAASSTFTWVAQGYTQISATGNTCTIDWGTPGAGKVIVNEISPYGCIGTKELCVEILESPIAHLVSLPDTFARTIHICKGTEVVFLDQSTFNPTSPIVSWYWDFGDGTYSNEKSARYMPVSHKYTNAGNYTVKLTVFNECGCSTTDSLIISVDPSPGVTITCPKVVCEGGTYNYRVNASCVGGTWQVIGGTINGMSSSLLNVTWNAVGPDGFGYVIYNAGGCPGFCPFPVAVKIPVIKTNGTIQGPDYLCVKKQYLYRMPQWPTTTYTWTCTTPGVTLQPTDQPNEIILSSTSTGTITLKCQYTNTLLSCSGTATKSISIPGAATITGPTAVCDGGEFSYMLVGPNPTTARWKLVDPFNNTMTGGPSPSYSASLDFTGTYLLTVTGSFCPPDPLEIRVVPSPAIPEIITGPGEICRGIPTEYTVGNIDANNIFVWSVTNGTVNSTVGEKSEITLNPGSTGPFNINVVRETKAIPHCQSLPKQKALSLPVVIFDVAGPTSVCPSQTYDYGILYPTAEAIDWSIYPQDMGSVMNATTGKGQGSQTAKVLWNKKPGNAKVICRVRKCNDYVYDTLNVTIKTLDVHITMPDSVCLIAAMSASIDEHTGGVNWYTGVQNVFSDTNDVIFNYEERIITYKKYYVTATVNTPFGCSTPSVAKDSIIVVPAPRVYLTPVNTYDLCKDAPVIAPFGVGYDSNYITPLSYTWYRGLTVVGTGPSYTATDTGDIVIVGAGTFGCPGTNVGFITTHECKPGRGGHTQYPGCPDMEVSVSVKSKSCDMITLKATRIVTDYDTTRWYCTAGVDSVQMVSADDTTATFKVLKAGAYKFGNESYYWNSSHTHVPLCGVRKDTTISFPYIPSLEVVPQCTLNGAKRVVLMLDHSTWISPITSREYAGYGGVKCSGNNLSCLTDAPVAPGVPNVTSKLTINGAFGVCSTFVTMPIPPLPDADFDFDRKNTCAIDAAVKFKNKSIPTFTNLTNLWDFEDGAQNTQGEPERVYSASRNYSVKLLVTDRWGCKDSLTKSVPIVADNLNGNVIITPPYPCEHSSALAKYNKILPTTPATYSWKRMNTYTGIVAPIGTTVVDNINVYQSGGYYASVVDTFGCYFDTPPDTVQFSKIPRAYIFGSGSQCVDVPFTLSGYVGPVPGLTYQWLLNGAAISGATTDQLPQTISTPITNNYRLVLTVPNPGGGFCSDTSDLFPVTIRKALSVTASCTVLNCNNYTVQLKALPNALPGTYNWSNGTFGSTVQAHYGGPFQVRYTDTFGCSSKAQVIAPKDLREYLWIFPTGCWSLCNTKPNIITGPIKYFDQFNYKRGATNVAGGTSGYFINYNLNTGGAGTYTMYLQRGLCNVTSNPMVVDFNCTPEFRAENTEVGSLSAAFPELTLAPNPAFNSTRVTYSYMGKSACYLQVFDMVGREVYGTELNNNSGSLDIDLGNFTPGNYRVVMRQGGHVLAQQRLSVTR
jgi:PKD repeat protein